MHVLCHTKTFDRAVTEWEGPIDIYSILTRLVAKTTQELKCEKLATRERKGDDLSRRKGSFKFAVLGANGDVFMSSDLLSLSLWPKFNDSTTLLERQALH